MFKKRFVRSFLSIIAVLAVTFLTTSYMRTVNATPAVQPANSLWVEPASLVFSAATTNVGDKFNVTVWTNMNTSTFTWQCELLFDPSVVQATRAVYTGQGKSEFFTTYGHGGTVPVQPSLDNATGSLIYGESLVGTDQADPGNGTLFWAEFQIMSWSTSGVMQTSINISTSSNTFWLAQSLDQIPSSAYNATFTFAQPPVIGTPIQTPPSDVQPNQTVMISTNVTDAEGVQNVTLYYTIDNATWTPIAMAFDNASGYWNGTIPTHTANTRVFYNITAFNTLDVSATNDNYGITFYYDVVPEFLVYMLVILMALFTAAAIGFRKKLTTIR